MNEDLIPQDITPEEIYENEFKPRKKTVENSRADLENLIIESLTNVLKNADKHETTLKAVQQAIDLLGLKEELIRAIAGRKSKKQEEKDLKNDVSENIDMSSSVSQALLRSIAGIETVSGGKANEIKTQQGGHGA